MKTLNPYMRAHAEYVKADRELSWTDALDWHLQVGAVVSTPDFFAMLRPVEFRWDDRDHCDSFETASLDGDTWHVWAMAGDLLGALTMAVKNGVKRVTYQRHGGVRLRRVSASELLMRHSQRLPCVKGTRGS